MGLNILPLINIYLTKKPYNRIYIRRSLLYWVFIKGGIYNRRCLLKEMLILGVSIMCLFNGGVYYIGGILKGVSFIVDLFYRGYLFRGCILQWDAFRG